jgi:hypothetical protein
MRPVFIWVFSSVFWRVIFVMPASSTSIVRTIIFNFNSSIFSDVFLVAFFALVYMTISHFAMLVKIGQGLNLSALKTTFHGNPLQLMSRGKNSIKYATLKGT